MKTETEILEGMDVFAKECNSIGKSFVIGILDENGVVVGRIGGIEPSIYSIFGVLEHRFADAIRGG